MDLTDSARGQIVIGTLPITGAHLLPAAIPLFQKEFPGIELVLVEETTNQLEQLTLKGQTDISLLSLPLSEKGLEIIPLLEEPILLAVPPHHPFSLRKEVALSECKKEPFIVLKKGQGFREISLKLCQEAGFEPHVVFESTNIETVQSLVASGLGIGFIPKMVTRTRRSTHVPVYLPIHDLSPTRTLVIGYKKGRYLSKAAESFIEIMRRVVNSGAY